MKEIEEVPSHRIYVLEREDGMVKIGVSNNPRKRMLYLASSGGFKITRNHESPPRKRTTVYELEIIIHNKLSKYRFSGEWFNCGFDKAVKAVSVIVFQARFMFKPIQPARNPSTKGEIAFEIKDGVLYYSFLALDAKKVYSCRLAVGCRRV